MRLPAMRYGLVVCLIFWHVTPVMSQTPARQIAAAPKQEKQGLAEFEGRYEYRDGLTVYMVTRGEQLVAIIDGSKYALRPSGTGIFLNPAGDSIPFIRDLGKRIVAFKEYGETFARLSPSVPEVVRLLLLLKARPDGGDGLPVEYKYQQPLRFPDGIQVGAAGPQRSRPTLPSSS